MEFGCLEDQLHLKRGVALKIEQSCIIIIIISIFVHADNFVMLRPAHRMAKGYRSFPMWGVLY